MTVSKRTRFEVLRRDNYTCRYCRATDNPLTVDHVTPVALGGTDNPNNLVAACRDCNSGKSSSSPDGATIAMLTDAEVAFEKARANVLARHAKKASATRRARQKFVDAWGFAEYECGLPEGWQASLSQWMSRGLTIDRIIDAVDIARSKKHIPAWARFNYAAKVCWNWIGELEDEFKAEAMAAQPRPASDFDQYVDRFDQWRLAAATAGFTLLEWHCDGYGSASPARFSELPDLSALEVA